MHHVHKVDQFGFGCQLHRCHTWGVRGAMAPPSPQSSHSHVSDMTNYICSG